MKIDESVDKALKILYDTTKTEFEKIKYSDWMIEMSKLLEYRCANLISTLSLINSEHNDNEDQYQNIYDNIVSLLVQLRYFMFFLPKEPLMNSFKKILNEEKDIDEQMSMNILQDILLSCIETPDDNIIWN